MIHRVLFAALALLFVLPACRPGSDPAESTTPESTDPVRGDTLVVAYKADAGVLNPLVAMSNLDLDIADFMFPYLVRFSFDCRCVTDPGLAESWEWSDDGLSLTLHLRDDATWTDGETIDAEDVLFTLGLIGDRDVGSVAYPFLQSLRAEEPVVKQDARTVVIHFDHRYDANTMLSHISGMPLVPEHVLRDWPRDNLRGAPFSSNPVSAGIFRFHSWNRGHELVLERNDGVTLIHAPYLDRVIFKIIPEYATRLVELQTGGVDMVQGIQVEDIEHLQRDHPEIGLHRRGMRSMDFVGWNLQDSRFADGRVRRALAHAIDVDALMAVLLRSGTEIYGARSVGTISPELCDFRNDEIQPIAHDMDRARELFAEAGWTDSDGDGVLDKDGQPFAFQLMTNAGNPRRAQAQVLIQEQLRLAGVEVELVSLENNTFQQKLVGKEFEAALYGLMSNLFIDPSNRWHSEGQPFNFVSYANPRVDELIDKGLAATDPAEAGAAWREMQAILYQEQPYCFLYWRDDVVALHQRFRDVKINTLAPFADLEDWWVPEAEQKHRF